MALNPLAIALQGLGFGAQQTAVSGFLTEVPEQDEVSTAASDGARWSVAARVRRKRRRLDEEDLLVLLG